MKKLSIVIGFIAALILSAISICAQTQSREDILKEISAKRTELAKLEAAFLLPPEEDRAKYADFLSQPDTGLIRLLPREKFDSDASKEARLTLRGGGAFYSFASLSHEYGAGEDIALMGGEFWSGFAGANYGMMTTLGNTPLENITLETPGVQFLAAHTPPTDEPKARIEQTRWAKGEMIDGTLYAHRLRVGVNTTYLLRSINYLTSDVLVAFRVVRVDTDGSAIILWKLLKKYPRPQIAQKQN